MAISKKVTIQQIADEAGVSIATVSRILNRSSNVNPDTRKRVMDAMKALVNAYRKGLLKERYPRK